MHWPEKPRNGGPVDCTVQQPPGLVRPHTPAPNQTLVSFRHRRVAPTDEAMPFRMCSGFQSISATFLIARAPNLGIAIVIKTSQPAACNWMICKSTVGSVVS